MNTCNQPLVWGFVYHDPKTDQWSLPSGFLKELETQGQKVYDFGFESYDNFQLPSVEFVNSKGLDVLLVFCTGFHPDFDHSLLLLKQACPHLLFVIELGDEPQTRLFNYVRAHISDVALTPDYSSFLYWKSKNVNAYWFTHWVDTRCFTDLNLSRSVFMGTTMGKRKYSFMLRLLLRQFFVNRRIDSSENSEFYSSCKIAFQYARWGEITRRIFEASACGCCVLTNRLNSDTNIEKLFKHRESILFFRNRFHLLLLILELLFRPNYSKYIAHNAKYVTLSSNTQTSRVAFLISICSSY